MINTHLAIIWYRHLFFKVDLIILFVLFGLISTIWLKCSILIGYYRLKRHEAINGSFVIVI